MSKFSKMVANDLMENGIDMIDLFNSTNWQEDINLYLDREDMDISQYVQFTLVVKINDEEIYVGDLGEDYANNIAVGFGALRYANCPSKELATEEHFSIYAYDEDDEKDEEIIILIKF